MRWISHRPRLLTWAMSLAKNSEERRRTRQPAIVLAWRACGLWCPMPATDIPNGTLNARFSQASLRLRYLLANLGDLAPCAAIHEFTTHDQPAVIVERLLTQSPRIVGFSVYIWNLHETRRVIGILKKSRRTFTSSSAAQRSPMNITKSRSSR